MALSDITDGLTEQFVTVSAVLFPVFADSDTVTESLKIWLSNSMSDHVAVLLTLGDSLKLSNYLRLN